MKWESDPVFRPLHRSFVSKRKEGKPFFGVNPYRKFCVHVHAVGILRY